MNSIGQLLRALGLERFEDAFAREDVDMEAARLLSDADFERLGVPLGPRRKLQAALATEAEVVSSPPAPGATVAATAERRQLTVLFCDLVGSTALSGSMDPEALRGLMGRYHEACRGVVEKYAGHVAQYLGDGVMAYFGWPVAHEDDAERALRAGLELVGAVKAVSGAPGRLQVRIGVATGPVVVGEGGEDASPGGGAGTPKLAVGETPNLAARLQGLAGPDEMVASAPTRRLAGGNFEVVDLGSHALKGIVEPVQAWKVVGLKETEGRFEASRGGEQRLSAFVGREQEVGLLGAKWSQAAGGEGQVVLLEGEPGIGKSRITQWLLEHIGGAKHYRLRYQCSPYHAQSAFHPVIEQIERGARFTQDDSPDARLDKLEALLNAPSPQSPRTLALFAALLGVGGGEARYGALNVTPQKQKELTLQALTGHVTGLSRDAPVLLLLEDAHWIDPSTLESLALTVEAIRNERVLVLITYRPEFKAQWTGQSHVSHVILNRLSAKQTRALAEHVAGGHRLPEEIVEQITTKTDGIPLFVEELTKAVLEAGLLELDPATNAYKLKGPLSPIAIPATLRDSLTARLDRLSPTKEVAQIGACIGRKFSYALVEKVAKLPTQQLEDALARLTDSELVFQRGEPPEATYTFKHALIQDAAYEGLLKSRRAQIHAQIAEVLEADFPEVTSNQPEVVAHHYTEAVLPDRAMPLWLVAGRKALSHFALDEAISQLSQGVALAKRCREKGAPADLELELRVLLGSAFTARYGWASTRVYEVFASALDLMGPDAPSELQIPVLWGLWLNVLTQGRSEESLEWVDKLFDAASVREDDDLLVAAHSAAQVSHFWAGNLIEADKHGDAVKQLFDAERYMRLALATHHNPCTTAGIYLAQSLWIKGSPDRALAEYLATVEFASKLSHPFDTCFAWTLAGYVVAYRREPDRISEATGNAYRISRELGIPFMEHVITPPVHAFALHERGEFESVCRVLKGVDAQWRAVEGRTNIPNWYCIWANSLARLGELGEARGIIELALEQIRTPGWGERSHLAEVLRTKGEIELLSGDVRLAEETFLESLAWAQEQQAKSWELRTAMSLARLKRSIGLGEEALALLRPIYEWFTEGRDTKDHIEARQLLNELEGPGAPK